MVQIGWKAGAEQFAPADLLTYAEQAEQADFDLIDISDHFHPWSEAGQDQRAFLKAYSRDVVG